MKQLLSSILLIFTISLSTFAATSESNRADKTWEILAQNAAFEYRMPTSQLSASYFLNAQNLLGFKAGIGANGKEKQTNFALNWKHYFGNSFYVTSEVFYLNTLENESWFIDTLFQFEKKYAKYTSMGAGIRIGNQWSWNHFTLGCDWFGLGSRVGVFNRDSDDLSKLTMTLLNLTLGFAF